jgi:hypothetical protein
MQCPICTVQEVGEPAHHPPEGGCVFPARAQGVTLWYAPPAAAARSPLPSRRLTPHGSRTAYGPFTRRGLVAHE